MRQPQAVLLCMCMCSRLCMYLACVVWNVCGHIVTENGREKGWIHFSKSSRSASQQQNQCTAVAQQQQYNGSRLPSSCLCASSPGVPGMCFVVGVQQEIQPRQHFASNVIIKHTSSELVTGTGVIHDRYSTRKNSTLVPTAVAPATATVVRP